jgi:hypothetical protein
MNTGTHAKMNTSKMESFPFANLLGTHIVCLSSTATLSWKAGKAQL